MKNNILNVNLLALAVNISWCHSDQVLDQCKPMKFLANVQKVLVYNIQ